MASNVKIMLDKLHAHRMRLEKTSMRQMFESDDGRFDEFSLEACGILLDYSKNRIDRTALSALFDVTLEAKVEPRRDEMWAGEPINFTEKRSVLHMALRYQGDDSPKVDGKYVMPDVREVLRNMEVFSDQVRDGTITGHSGQQFTDIVNIGIGGSDLGPAMVAKALKPYARADLRAHFVSNVDGAQIHDILEHLDPHKTLFIVASKTFSTDETMTNAATARDWLVKALGAKAVADHFTAVSTNLEACAEFGIQKDRIFGFWDWVGGRYSIWSAIGLPIAIIVGFENFKAFLGGAAAMDKHFLGSPIEENMPIIMALLGIWYRNVWNFPTHAILPYDQRLCRFPAYLQQLDMESNGKSVSRSGASVDYATGPIVWGEPGTNGQHAFYQLLHQGTDIVPVDFMVAAKSHEDLPAHHEKLVANCFAQGEALMKGKSAEEVEIDLNASGLNAETIKKLLPHKIFPGNRPSNMLLYEKLDPAMLGSLIALYEHKIFVQGIIWDINSFDQWGVELGKQLANNLLKLIKNEEKMGEGTSRHSDSSTEGLLARFHHLK